MATDPANQPGDGGEGDGSESEPIRQLREANKAKEKELKELRAFKEDAEPKLRSVALRDAGFDPDNIEEGPTAALLRLHEGELTADGLKATAEKYGLAPPQGEGEGTGTTPPELSAEQQQTIASAERGQQVQTLGQPPEPPQTLDAQIAAAREAGDLQKSLALKNQKLAQLAQ